jgi:hypothetical protein
MDKELPLFPPPEVLAFLASRFVQESMLSTLAHMAHARSSFTSPGACQASKLIASALEMVRRCPSAHSFLACLNTLCAHRLTCASRVTTGQAATAEAKRAPLRPTHSALKCFDLVLSNMLLWQGAADFS